MAGAKQEIMKKCDNSKMDCFVKKGVTGTVDVCSLKIGDKVKRKPRITSSAYRWKLFSERIYTVFQMPKWSGDGVVLNPFNFEG